MNVGTALETNTERTEVMHPGMRAFNAPAILAKAAAMFSTALGDHRFDTTMSQRASMPLGVVITIGVDHTRSAQWMAAQSANRWNRVDQRRQLRDVVDIRAGQARGERRAVGVGDEKSIWSAARRFASGNPCKRFHTPAACQSRSRRQQVAPERQPVSAGRSVAPAPSRLENEQDAGQRGVIRNRQAAWVLLALRLGWRQ